MVPQTILLPKENEKTIALQLNSVAVNWVLFAYFRKID